MTKILVDKAVLEQALEALKASGVGYEIDALVFWEKQHAAVSALRAALEQPQVNSPEIPEGWRLVPVEPNDDLHLFLVGAYKSQRLDHWKSILKAASQPPTTEKSSVVEHAQVEQEPRMLCDVCASYVAYPSPKREPLTDEQLHTLWLYAPVDNYTTHEELFKQAARHTERAHRIGTPNDSKTN